MVIEDGVTYQQALKREFTQRGYEVCCASTGEDGLLETNKALPDLIILDLLLPGINGREVCRILKMNPKYRYIPVMMLTMQREDKAVVEGIEAGADSYVNKNETMEVIVRRAEALIKLSAASGPLLQEEEGKEETINLTDKKILLVDDDITYLQGLKRQLVVEGYQVITGMSGVDCFLALKNEIPDLLLLDLKMPEIDGIDTCRQIRKSRRFQDLPIVMLTASDAQEDVVKSFEAGVNDYIVKSNDFRVTKTRVYSIIRRRHFENINRDLNDRMIRQEKLAAMGQLASIIGHEIRGPLGVIRNSVYFLKMKLGDNPDQKMIRHLTILDEEVVMANRIIEDTLDFARVKEPNLADTDVATIVRDALSREPMPSNIEVVTEFREDLPLVKVDPLQMGRVFCNLAINAAHAMPGGGRLVIASQKVVGTDQGKKQVEISVQDTGSGINSDVAGKIFEPLFTTKSKGTGLGLPVCRNIVEAHKGTLSLESRSGEGARFVIRLPEA